MGKSKDIQKKKAASKGDKKSKMAGRDESGTSELKVVFDEKTWESFVKDVPKKKCITLSAVSAQFGISKPLAKIGLKRLREDGVIRLYVDHSKMPIYIPVEKEEEDVKLIKNQDDEEEVEEKKE